jgi:hypothetical protein
MDKLTITQEMIEAGMSDNGALSFKQIDLLGFGRYSGWRRRAVGKEILTEKYNEFLALKNVHLKNKKKHKNSVLVAALDFIFEHFTNEDGFCCPFREDCNNVLNCDECKVKKDFDILIEVGK